MHVFAVLLFVSILMNSLQAFFSVRSLLLSEVFLFYLYLENVLGNLQKFDLGIASLVS